MAGNQDAEQRFAHVLRPLRDLASNWNIDLAHELEEYIEELEKVTVSFDGGETNLNFAEAALVIQGSACVYSKKVEYLYSLIYQTLDHLAQQHKRSQRQTSVRPDGTDADAPFDDEDGLLPLDDVLKEGTNIDMAEDGVHGGPAGVFGQARGSLFPDPDRQAGRFTTPGNHIDSAGALTSRTPLSVMGSFQCQAADRGASFNLSHCSVHESGALMLDANRRAVMELSADISHISVAGTPPGAPLGRVDGQEEGGQESKGFEGAAEGNEADNFVPDDNWDNGEDGGGWDMAGDADGEAAPQQAHQPQAARQVRFEEPVDVWATLDPYEGSSQSTRKLKPGRTFTVPSDLKAIAKGTARKRRSKATANSAVNANATKNRSVSLLTSKPFFSMLAPLHAAQQRRQRALKRARRLAGEAEYTPSAGVDDDEEDAGGFVVFGNEADDFVPDYEDYAGMADEDAGGNEDAATSRFGGEDGPMPMNLDADMERSLADAPTSYEELCRHHIAAFMRAANRFKEESGITRRVMDWQSRMEPILAAEELRPAFDIHEYGHQVMHTLEDDVASDGEDKGEEGDVDELLSGDYEGMDDDGDESPATAASNLVKFERVVAGMPPEEVCRVFLASLQLANAGNVRLVHEVALPDDAPGHHLRMRMLTAEEPVDMEAYRAPSAAVAAAPTAATVSAASAKPPRAAKSPRKRAKKRGPQESPATMRSRENAPRSKVARKTRSTRRTRSGASGSTAATPLVELSAQ